MGSSKKRNAYLAAGAVYTAAVLSLGTWGIASADDDRQEPRSVEMDKSDQAPPPSPPAPPGLPTGQGMPGNSGNAPGSPQPMPMAPGPGFGDKGPEQMHQLFVETLAENLDMDVDVVADALDETQKEMADRFKKDQLKMLEEKLQKAVEQGKLTQKEADKILEQASQAQPGQPGPPPAAFGHAKKQR